LLAKPLAGIIDTSTQPLSGYVVRLNRCSADRGPVVGERRVSRRDQSVYGDIAARFVGEAMHVGLAANSLQLVPMTALRTPSERYIWIDPPWRLVRHEDEVVTGAYCPEWEPTDDEAKVTEYSIHFKAFCDAVAVLRGAILEAIVHDGDGTTRFVFGLGFTLVVSPGEAALEHRIVGHDDWYAKDMG
jgi:hypothetical protein